MHAGEDDHARPGWTTSRLGQNSPWKSQSEWQRTEISGESTSPWCGQPSDRGRLQNRTETTWKMTYSVQCIFVVHCIFARDIAHQNYYSRTSKVKVTMQNLINFLWTATEIQWPCYIEEYSFVHTYSFKINFLSALFVFHILSDSCVIHSSGYFELTGFFSIFVFLHFFCFSCLRWTKFSPHELHSAR